LTGEASKLRMDGLSQNDDKKMKQAVRLTWNQFGRETVDVNGGSRPPASLILVPSVWHPLKRA
jgi:hypothetical protein